ncbi:post-transcriptional regulator [Mesobacillus foraminis]|uniref:ComN-like post-transcriptional regulator n=1 Tax=Mesobacillus foraminis TaxID=279826 RepID=A0A4V2RDF2_9BACI|nr:post-transcriptional regulator [Mesobacillus foraminis]TCN24590.1 ComN-like post-transcriptional regulator [Mesobacillus foraminis]
MDFVHKYEAFQKDVQPALKSKQEELAMLGYEGVTEQEIWNFLTRKKWKKTKDDIRLYEIVADILSVQPGEYMNFVTIEAFKIGSLSLDDEKERRELLK